MPKDKKSFKDVRQDILKEFGSESISSWETSRKDIDVISTSSILLDKATGVKGFPRGRIVELFGVQSSGKSTLALQLAVECQKTGSPVIYLDYEHALDVPYAESIGVSFKEENFIHSQPESLEQGMKIAEMCLENSLSNLIIVDSLAAMVTEKELAGEIGDTTVAIQARAMSQVLRRLTHVISTSNTLVVFINQLRDTIATMPGRSARPTTPGGRALKFYASMRVELTAIESVKGKIEDSVSGKQIEGPVALKVKATVVKNKLARPYMSGFFWVGEGGILDEYAVLEVAESRSIVQKNGTRFVLPFHIDSGDKPVNLAGRQAVIAYLKENPHNYSILRKRVLELMEGSPSEDSVELQESSHVLSLDRDNIPG